MTTSNGPEGAEGASSDRARLAVLLPDPGDGPEPLFQEPWQAEAFALVVHLHETGAFTWAAWVDELSTRIARAGDDDGTRYYEHWLGALEALVISTGLADQAAIDERTDAWAEAYRSTPHGQPVELSVDRRGGAPG